MQFPLNAMGSGEVSRSGSNDESKLSADVFAVMVDVEYGIIRAGSLCRRCRRFRVKRSRLIGMFRMYLEIMMLSLVKVWEFTN